ncbi:TPA: phage major capsid protein, partial [Klebsiella pneumoniae]|nr:phage major capsid protein [Klebsiella pneumoniae]
MSELSVLEKAIENSQKEVKELIEEQRKSINQTGEINKQLQTDLTKTQEELKAAGTRLFDLEQKLAGNSPDQTAQKSFAQRVSEDLMKGWDG